MVSLTLWKKKKTFISGLYSMTRCFKRFSLFSHFIIVIKKKNWKHGNLIAIPLVYLAHSYGVLKHRLSSTFLRICSGLPRLNLAYYDQTPSQSTLMSTQLSLIMQDRSCSLKLSLFPPSQISVGPNSGSLWRVIGERAHWFGGLGEGHVWTHRREGEGARERGHVWHVCMYGGWLGSAASLRNPPKTSTHFLCWCWRCSVGLMPRSSSGVCSVQGPNISYGFIKAPKERKCGSCSDFSSARSNPVMPVLKCGMVNGGNSVSRWTHSGKQTSQSSL